MAEPEPVDADDRRRALGERIATRGRTATDAPMIAPRPAGDTAPLSFAQERLWFFDQLHPASPLYLIPFATRIRAPLSPAILERALGEIVRRHESLRTSFAMGHDAPVQRVAPHVVLPFAVQDLRDLPSAQRETRARAITAEEAARPFDLGQAPLVRARLIIMGEADNLLLVTMHHIVSDGWSVRVFHRELGDIYTAFAHGRPSPLDPLPIQYGDFAAWQRAELGGAALDAHLDFWRGQLADAPPLITLPTDRPRPAVQSYRGGLHLFAIEPELGARLRGLARAEGATPFVVLLAAFQLLLARHGGQDDIVVGTPIANRPQIELEGLIGFFVDTLALRARIDPTASFRSLLAQVRETTLSAYAHQDLPFERLVEALQPDRSLGHNPLFQVLFALQTDGEAQAITGPRDTRDAPRDGMARFDLALAMADAGNGFDATVEFSRDLFDDATIEGLADRFRTLLAGIVAAPDLPVARLPLLAPAMLSALVRDWNGPRHAYAPDLSFPDLVAAIATAWPAHLAVDDGATRLSYADLIARARALAATLTMRGIGPEDRVGVCLTPSATLVIAFLGVLMAGAAYVPLDPALPCARLAHMARDAEVGIVLGRAEDGHDWIPQGIALIDPDRALSSPHAAPTALHPDHCAYVIYTSGSTGTPKGVAIPHAGLARIAFNQRMLLAPTPADRVLHFASIGFDASIFEMMLALGSGACLHLASRDDLAPGATLAGVLRARRITMAVLPPAACAITPEVDLPDLALLMMAGEAVDPGVATRWARGRRLLNGYGPTEAAVWASTGGFDPASARMPIGVPCINIRLYVLDAFGQPVPAGVTGELHIGGEGLARGYVGRPDLTAERFVPDPFSDRPGGRLYRTGDKVRMLANGMLDYRGRDDGQVKIRGFRIELGEVETALAAAPGVGEAAVVTRGEDAARRLEAHLSPAGAPIDPDAVRRHLRERLPDHMIPSAIHLHDALPITPNGKIDRAALAATAIAPPPGAIAPRDATEAAIAAIWADLLEIESVAVDRNFFEMGGHSLLATRLVSRLRERFGVDLPLRTVFEAPTVAAQAALLGTAAADTDAETMDAALRALASGIGPAEKRALLARLLAEPAGVPTAEPRTAPLSFAQERLWFFDQLHPASALYIMPFAMRIREPVSPAILERALGEIVRRHETLRTSFAVEQGVPVQRIAPDVILPFATEDLRALSADDRETRAQAIAAEEAARPFDLGQAPLIRARLLVMGDRDHVVLLTLHHIVSDGWSMGVLYRELGQVYAAFAQGRPSPLEPLPIQYADFATRQREQLQGAALDAHLAFWREQLDGAPALIDLPTDRPRPAVQRYRGGLHAFAIPPDVTRGLRVIAGREGATLFMAATAAVTLLLARHSDQDDIVIGTPIASRTRRDVEGLIGFFVNTLVLRARIDRHASFRDLLARVRETTLAAYAHQDLPFERLVEDLQPERTLGHNPLFQVMMLFQAGTPGDQREPQDPPPGDHAPEMVTGTSKFDLTFALAESGGGLSGAIEYNSDLFDPDTVATIARHLTTLMAGLVTDPDAPVARLAMIDAVERTHLLTGLTEADRPFPDAPSIDALIARRAAAMPDAPALAFADGEIDYRALDAQANRLARALRAKGAKPGARIGLWLDRSAALVVAMLATWRTGAAFIALDTRHPPDRLAAMLADAGVSIVVGAKGAVRVPQGGVMFDLDAQANAIAKLSAEPLEHANRPHDLAQIIFTSGSTGAPKGVMIEHRQLLWLLDAMASAEIGAGDRVGQASNPAFDVMAYECWGALTAGACLVGITRDELLTPDGLARAITERGLTVLYQTAALFNQTAAHRADAYRGIRLLLVGGDVVEPAKVRAAMLASAIPVFKHTYGPTETTVFCSVQTLTAPPAEGAGLSLAPALPNARLYVVDRDGALTPTGGIGELWIGGACVARGYIGRPDLTATAFVPDPFDTTPGARAYRSGDLARLRADGTLEFMGRADAQVKIRGHRIEPAEIDTVLRGAGGVRDVATICRGTGAQRQLVAYVVATDPDAPPVAEALRRHCKLLLPDPMVPTHFVGVAALPITPNGKLDRAALPLPERIEPGEIAADDAPRGGTEAAIAAIWRRILNVARVGRTEHFFDIGGHSLLATQVISRIRDELGADIALRTIFEAPTLAELAAATEAALGVDAPSPSEPALVALSRDAYRRAPLPAGHAA